MAKASLITKPVRAIYIGDSGSGKTGSLISLLQAGYSIRMLDLDNNADSLLQLCLHHDPALLDKLDIISPRDDFRASMTAGVEVSGRPKAFVDTLKALEKWDDGTSLKEWDDKTVFVLDTLTAFGRAAFHWAKGMNPTSKDPRQWYGAAQEVINTTLQLLTADTIPCHVLVLSHVSLIERSDGSMKGYPTAIGKALGPTIASFFPTFLMAETKTLGSRTTRTISTAPSSMFDLKNPTPFKMENSYPLETGLASIFEILRGT